MHPYCQTDAIVLKVVSYKDYDRIVTLLTERSGILSAYLRGALRPNSALNGLQHPCSLISITYQSTRGETVKVSEGTLLDGHLGLRQDLDRLQVGLYMTDAIYNTLLPKHPAKEHYQLLKSFLNQTAKAENPKVFLAGFLAKLMKLEGTLSLSENCDRCKKSFKETSLYLDHRENLCESCKQGSSVCVLSPEEQLQIFFLSHTRSWTQLKNLPMTDGLERKILSIFRVSIEKECARGGT